MDNANKLAVVTGASSGIGYELARVFAQNGFDLMIVAEDGGIADAASALKSLGVRVDYAQIDLASESGARNFYDRIRTLGRPVEILAVNAGVGVGGEFAETELEREIEMMNLNVISSVALTKFVLKDMLGEGHGRILITSSIAGEMPGPYHAVYAATKAFLQSFAEALHYELKDRGIVVTSLQPGATETNFFKRADMEDTKVGKSEKDDPAEVAKDGFDALMAGKDHAVAGSFMNKLMVEGKRVMTQQMGAKMAGKQAEPDSKH